MESPEDRSPAVSARNGYTYRAAREPTVQPAYFDSRNSASLVYTEPEGPGRLW